MQFSARIASLVRFHRARAKLSQQGLARSAGVGKTVVFDIEHGKSTVRLATLLKVLDVLNIRLRFDGPLVAEWRAGQEGP